jgi:hypothetical protein
VHLPHPGLRHLARDAAIAAVAALAVVALSGSVGSSSQFSPYRDGGTSDSVRPVEAARVVIPPATAAVTARIDVEAGGAGPVAQVRLPAGGTITLRVVDARGATVADLATTGAPGATHQVVVAPGAYRVLASRLGPVETVGDTAIASSAAVRSEAITVGEAGVLTVVLVAA